MPLFIAMPAWAARLPARPAATLMAQALVLVPALALTLGGMPHQATAAGPSGTARTAPAPGATYEDAVARYQADDVKGAMVQLKNVLAANPRHLAAHVLLGRALFKSGQLKAAEAAFEEALKLGVSRDEIMLDLGRLRLLFGDYRQTLEMVPEQLPDPARQAEALVIRATAYMQLGEAGQAARSVAAAQKAAPAAAAPLLMDSLLRLQQGDVAGARSVAQRAVDLAPQDAAAWSGLARVQQQARDNKGALASLDRALALAPRQAEARVARAGLRLGAGQDALALEDLQALKAADVVDPRAAYMRGTLAARRNDRTAAQAAYQDAVALVKALPKAVLMADSQMLMAGALAAKALGEAEQAREFVSTLLGAQSRHIAAQLLMAELLYDAKDYRRARQILVHLRDSLPDDARLLTLLGATERALKNQPAANELLERAFKVDGSAALQRALGTGLLDAGQDARGLAHLEQAFAARPPDVMAGIQLAIALARRNQPQKALATAEAVVRTDPHNLDLQNFHANIKGRLGDMAGARKIWEAALAKDPTFRQIVINLCWLDIEQQRFGAARARLAAHLQRHVDDPDVLFQLGMLEKQARQPAEAERHWARALDLYRNDARPGLALVDLWLEQGQPDKALPVAKNLRVNFAGQRAPLLALARTHLAKGDAPGAKAALVEATMAPGDDAIAQVTIGRLLLSIGETKAAAYNVVKARQIVPDHLPAMLLQVDVEAAQGSTPGVDAALKALVAAHPKAAQTLVARANVALSRGNAAAAVTDLQSAMQLTPGTPVAIMLARALVAVGQPAKAVSHLEAWTRRHPEDKLALLTMADLQAGTRQPDAARATYKRLLSLDPNEPLVLARLAALLHQANDAQALGLAERAYAGRPESAEYADLLGWIHARRGNIETALPLLRNARLRNPGSAEVHFHLAYALAKAGRTGEARAELQAALKTPGPGLSEPAEVERLKTDLDIR